MQWDWVTSESETSEVYYYYYLVAIVKIFHKLNALSLKRMSLIFDSLLTGAQQVPLNSLCSYHITVVGGLIWSKDKTFDSSETSPNIAQSAKQQLMMKHIYHPLIPAF